MPDLGKGSHGIMILGDRRTVVRNPKDELKSGTLHAMLKQLGLSQTKAERLEQALAVLGRHAELRVA